MKLLDRLHACVTDEREIEPLLSYAAGGSARFGPQGAVEYLSGPEHTLFARLRVRDGKITELVPGPQLQSVQAQEAFLDQAKTQTSRVHGTFVVSRVLFGERRLQGSFSWGDRLRISPCPASAPIGRGFDWTERQVPGQKSEPHLGPPFPFLMEVRVHRSPNPFLETNRLLRALDTFQHILTVLLIGRVRYVHWGSDRQWVSLRSGDVIENHLVHAGFSTGESGRMDDFPERTVDLAPVFDGPDYYDHLWPHDSELVIPSTLERDLATFDALPQIEASAFARASYFYALAVQFVNEPSMSTIAFSAAIECLLPRLSASPCDTCGKPVGPGPTKLFNRHLQRYALMPDQLKKRRNELYGVRSALVHGSRAARVDFDFFSAVSSSADYGLLLEITAQRSLIGWLRDPDRSVWHSGNHECAS
jgi:hypothetical protein